MHGNEKYTRWDLQKHKDLLQSTIQGHGFRGRWSNYLVTGSYWFHDAEWCSTKMTMSYPFRMPWCTLQKLHNLCIHWHPPGSALAAPPRPPSASHLWKTPEARSTQNAWWQLYKISFQQDCSTYPVSPERAWAQLPWLCRFPPCRKPSDPPQSPQMFHGLWPCKCAGVLAETGQSQASWSAYLWKMRTVLMVFIALWLCNHSANCLCKLLTLSFWLSKDMHDLCLGRILTQSPDQIPTLGVSDFHLVGWCPIKQLESVFEVCEQRADQVFLFWLLLRSLRSRVACYLWGTILADAAN